MHFTSGNAGENPFIKKRAQNFLWALEIKTYRDFAGS